MHKPINHLSLTIVRFAHINYHLILYNYDPHS